MPTLDTVQAVNSGTSNPATLASFVVPSGTKAILVRTHVRTATGTSFTGVTWNGTENFTLVTSKLQGTIHVAIWLLVNPTATTADIVATWSGTVNAIRIAAQNVDGLDTADPYRTPPTALSGSSGTSMSIDVPSAVGDLVVDCGQHSQSAGTATLGGGQTSIYSNNGMGGTIYYAHSSYEDGAATVTMSRTWGASAPNWAICAISLKPAAVNTGRRSSGPRGIKRGIW